MIVLDWEEFATLCPPGTIFSFADPMLPDDRRGLMRKVDTLYYDDKPSDFTYIDLLPQENRPFSPFDWEPATYEILTESNCVHRWGEYDYDVKYIVFQEADLELLKAALKEAVPCR